jgi:hypothetical protein
MQAVKAAPLCPANGENEVETFSTPCDLVWFATIAEAVYGLIMVGILERFCKDLARQNTATRLFEL